MCSVNTKTLNNPAERTIHTNSKLCSNTDVWLKKHAMSDFCEMRSKKGTTTVYTIITGTEMNCERTSVINLRSKLIGVVRVLAVSGVLFFRVGK